MPSANPSLYVRAYRTQGDPHALGDLTLAELAALRLEGPGEPAPEPRLSAMIRRMQAQADIGRLVLERRVTPQDPEWTGYFLKTVTVAHDDYSFAPGDRGKTKTVAYSCSMGPMPTDPKEYRQIPDKKEEVVTRQAARDLYDFDPDNWSDAALTWCKADKQLSLQEQLDRWGVSMTAEEVEALKTETCKKSALMPELQTRLKAAGYPEQKIIDIMDKKTKDDYPWVRLADTGKQGYYYKNLLLRLFEVMLPDKRNRPHLIEDDRRRA